MAHNEQPESNISVSVPIGVLASVVLLGAAIAAYLLLNREEEGDSSAPKVARAKGMRKRLGLMAIVTLLENDATRKVVLALLRAMARRA